MICIPVDKNDNNGFVIVVFTLPNIILSADILKTVQQC